MIYDAFAHLPIYGLEDLGSKIAADSRFTRCAAEQYASGLLRRPIGLEIELR